jgi:hypothetical protein
MKTKLVFGAAFLFVVWAATSCEALSGCKKCKDVIYEYCGAELIAKEATPDVTVGSQTTKVECR